MLEGLIAVVSSLVTLRLRAEKAEIYETMTALCHDEALLHCEPHNPKRLHFEVKAVGVSQRAGAVKPFLIVLLRVAQRILYIFLERDQT